MKTRLTSALAVGALGLALTACGSDPTEGDKSATDTITIGSAAFPENEIIAEIYAQALEDKGSRSRRSSTSALARPTSRPSRTARSTCSRSTAATC